jgi:hypothetical protein
VPPLPAVQLLAGDSLRSVADEQPPPDFWFRLRWYATTLPVQTAVAYVPMAAAAVALGYASSFGTLATWLVGAGSIALLLLLGFAVFAFLLFEDDWWNDVMWEQTTAMLLALALHVVALPAAWLWGRGLGG